jgi:hypothetical protein
MCCCGLNNASSDKAVPKRILCTAGTGTHVGKRILKIDRMKLRTWALLAWRCRLLFHSDALMYGGQRVHGLFLDYHDRDFEFRQWVGGCLNEF